MSTANLTRQCFAQRQATGRAQVEGGLDGVKMGQYQRGRPLAVTLFKLPSNGGMVFMG